MCGVTGLFDISPASSLAELERLVDSMAAALTHRGPDDAGTWVDEQAGIGLGHRRLAVIDLTSTGHQPMVSASGATVVVFNGEIYNHRELRRDLEGAGRRFRGHSDTETLVEAIDTWGLRRTLERVNGMFAIASWDRRDRVLRLARDRLGEKPLYHGIIGGRLAFASELRALRAVPGFRGDLDPRAVASLLRWSFIPHPLTIHRGIEQLAPGTILEARRANGRLSVRAEPYWSLREIVAAGAAARRRPSPPDAADELVDLLGDAVRLRLESDVPMGAFLSGGIDSSFVAALAQAALAPGRLHTFTVAMPDIGLDESAAARGVAAHLGTDHHTVELSAAEALDTIPALPTIYDEPFADPSMLPSVLLARVARRQVTVSLAGDGGDEVFGGYNRHALGWAVARRAGWIPSPARRALARVLLLPSPATIDAAARRIRSTVRRLPEVPNPGDKAQKLSGLLAAEPGALWSTLAGVWPATDGPMLPGSDPFVPTPATATLDPVEQLLLLDTEVVLPDDMLTKVDRASMAVALEVRVPFLDHRLVEWAWRLPPEAKVGEGRGKVVVREALRRLVPDALVDRPKLGFDPPLDTWLRGPLRPWAEDLLSGPSLSSTGLLDPVPIRRTWAEHLSGRRNWDYRLWSVLMFTAWCRSVG